MKKYFIVVALLALGFDQGVKWLVMDTLAYGTSVSVLNSFFKLTYVQNDGAAWSLFSGNQFFLIGVAFLALVFIYCYLVKSNTSFKMEVIFGLLYGGILGNLIDRLRLGYVVDYFDFNIFGYAFPVFNIADICIVIAVIGVIIYEWRSEKNENMESGIRK